MKPSHSSASVDASSGIGARANAGDDEDDDDDEDEVEAFMLARPEEEEADGDNDDEAGGVGSTALTRGTPFGRAAVSLSRNSISARTSSGRRTDADCCCGFGCFW